MLLLGDIIAKMQSNGFKFDDPKTIAKSSRNEFMAQIHQFYLDDKFISDRLNYAKWLRRNKLKPCQENIDKWKKTSGEFRKPITPASLASFWLAHIPTTDLYYLISIAKDKKNRKESFNKWLFWAIKA